MREVKTSNARWEFGPFDVGPTKWKKARVPEAIARANLSAQAHSLTELGVLALLLVSALTAREK